MSKKQQWKIADLLRAQPALERIVALPTSRFKEDPALVWDLARIYRQIEPEVSVAHQQRIALMRECGAQEEGQNLVFKDLKAQTTYQERFDTEIGDVSRSLNVEPLSWDRLTVANLDMRVADLALLEGLVFVREEPE